MKLLDKRVPRDNNIELLRICLMFMIVLLHIVSHGLEFISSLINNSKNSNIDSSHIFIFNLVIISVNSFVIISGYYGIKFKYETLINFWKQALMTSLILLIFSLLVGDQKNSINILKSFFPIISNYWWYLSTYILLFLLSPFINSGLENLNKREFQRIIILLFICNCIGGFLFNTFNANNGYSILNFIFLYLLGRYCNFYKVFDKTRLPLIIYLISLFFNFSIGLFLYNNSYYKYFLKFYDYNNPFVLLNSILFVILFFKINIQVNFRKISQLTLGIYLFHDNDLIRSGLPFVMKSSGILYIFFCAFIIFCAGAIIEFIRQKFSELIDIIIQ